MMVSVVVVAFASRYFGPEVMGQLNYAVAFVSLFTAVGTLGLESVVVKALGREPLEEGAILGTALLLRIVSGVILTSIAGVTIALLDRGDSTLTYLVLLMSIAMTLRAFEVMDYWVQANLCASEFSRIRIIVMVLTAGLKIGLVLSRADIVLYAATYSLDVALVGVASLILYFRIRSSRSRWRFEVRQAGSLLRDSRSLVAAGLMISIYNRIDQVMLGGMVQNRGELGLYSAAVTISEMWYFVPMAIIVSLRPGILAKKKSGGTTYVTSVQTLYNLITVVTVVFCLGIALCSGPIIFIVYGSVFAGAAPLLAVVVWSGIFAMLGVGRSTWLVAEGLQRYSMFYTLLACVINIALNLFLIPRMGAMGAAIATVIAQMVNVIALSVFPKTRISTRMMIRSFHPASVAEVFRMVSSLRSVV